MASTGASYRVLIVEDEYLLAENLRTLFDENGFEVLGPAFSADEAMDLIDHIPHIDAAVVDLELKGKLCLPVLDALQDRHIPILLSSGHDVTAMPPRYRSLPMYRKPLLASELVARLFRLIEGDAD